MVKKVLFGKIRRKILIAPTIFLEVIVVGITLFFAIFIVNFYLRIYPNVTVAGTNVGGMSTKVAVEAVQTGHQIPKQITINLSNSDSPLTLNSEDINATYETALAVDNAYKIGRSGDLQTDLVVIFLSLFKKQNVDLPLSLDEEKIRSIVAQRNLESASRPIIPTFVYSGKKLTVRNGVPGEVLNAEIVIPAIKNAIRNGANTISINLTKVDPTLPQSEIDKAIEMVAPIADLSLKIGVDDISEELTGESLVSLYSPGGDLDQSAINTLLDDLATQINRDPQNPVFQFESNRVKEFAPAKEGLTLLRDQAENEILNSLETLKNSKKSQTIDLPVNRIAPNKQTSDVNNLGIKELIGRGTSKFAGSIASRLFNVALAASRINGVLVPPGETFSFAKAVGDVSKLTGYKEAYIIQDGRTILGDGGGVCQVSTTLFRAVMNAGLPIIERHPHAYRVGYYEQDAPAGYDATVYLPSVDFKFKNDTENYILIQTKVDTKAQTADFEIYGTKDGRTVSISKPVLTNQIPPPDDQYIDDPTLPMGKIQQVEHKAWGGTSTFNYIVSKNGETLFSKTFVSVYQPWRAVFMRGVGPS